MEKKLEEIVKFLKENCHKYQRFYTPSYMSSDINDTKTIEGVRLNISYMWGYVDILGLTTEEENELEKVMEADDALKEDEDDGEDED